MIDPSKVCLFIPGNLAKFKLALFNRIAGHIEKLGGKYVRGDFAAMGKLPDEITPIIGCNPEFRPMVASWRARKRQWIYWDRGYLRRVFATHLPTGNQLGIPGGYYRWTLNHFQMQTIRDVPDDRWKYLKLEEHGFPRPWRKTGDRIVIADTGPDYWNLHADLDWSRRTAENLRKITNRPVFIRDKESKHPLEKELADAHCLITHGSIAAVEAVVMGVPVFVSPDSAAAPMGLIDFSKIEAPVYPERQAWLNSLSYSQYNEAELCNGTLWKLIA